MAGAKRMSAEEKRQVILGIYHKSKQVFTEKEILTLAAKAGVNGNTIIDINMSLIDDGLVDKEKIGNSNYFWSFPAKKDRIMQLQHQQNLADVEQLKTASEEASARLADAKRGREDGNDRPAKLLRLTTALQERAALEAEYETLKENDPAALDLLEKELTMTTHAAKRWTDNILECKCYLKKKMAYNEKDACKAIQIPISFDYPVDKIPK